jgi:hypothetical protein
MPSKRARSLCRSFLLPLAISLPRTAAAQKLTWSSSAKLFQVNGDCDWTKWDPATRTCAPGGATASRTVTRADILGDGLGYSFEALGGMIFLFGDTIGATKNNGIDYSEWTTLTNEYAWQAHDPVGWSFSTIFEIRAGRPLEVPFRPGDGTDSGTVYVNPQIPNTQPPQFLDMGGDDVANSGIFLRGKVYLIVNSGSNSCSPPNPDPHACAFSSLTTWDGPNHFTALRDISHADAGEHFVFDTLLESPYILPGFREPAVVMFGTGGYRRQNLYLAIVPSRNFERGAGIEYYQGPLLNSSGKWTWTEADAPTATDSGASPLIPDYDSNHPSIGNPSITYSRDLKLWLLTFDGGRPASGNTEEHLGVYCTYAHSRGVPGRLLN